MNKTKVRFQMCGYVVYEHTSGRHRFAVWREDTLLCWCPDFDTAERIVRAMAER